jgi:hypothetical protein
MYDFDADFESDPNEDMYLTETEFVSIVESQIWGDVPQGEIVQAYRSGMTPSETVSMLDRPIMGGRG